jgi:hypothetical protein
VVYTGGGIGGAGAPAKLPPETPGGDAPAPRLLAAARSLLGDARPPTATIAGPRVVHRPKKGLVVVRVRDDKALAQLLFVVDRKTYQFNAKPGEKALAASVKLVNLGKRTLKGAAIDRAGNRSKTVVLHVRVLRR